MLVFDPRSWGAQTFFDPAHGRVIRQPPGTGPGYWAGAPGAYYDPEHDAFYVVYRLRWPRGVAPDRGAELRLARSVDGMIFTDVWAATKGELHCDSIERCALARAPSGRWLLYVSYVDPADRRWRIDVVEAARPDGFDLRRARPALTAADTKTAGVKDPWIFRVAGLYHMIASVALAPTSAPEKELHATADAYNTGLIRSATGLATSDDGLYWQWEGTVLTPREHGWDRYCSRISCLWYEAPLWLALYDGSADVSENYEERCGLAYSFDLRHFHRATPVVPLLLSPHGRASLRYVDMLVLKDAKLFYYEMARPDGSHDLRVYHMARV
jgi:hypothetical protein